MMGAMVRHCVGMSFARWSSFSSSSLVHSVFLMEGSSHSYQRALHCLADLRTSSELMRAHWLRPYFMTAALRISSCCRMIVVQWCGEVLAATQAVGTQSHASARTSVFFHTPPRIRIFMVMFGCCGSSQGGVAATTVLVHLMHDAGCQRQWLPSIGDVGKVLIGVYL